MTRPALVLALLAGCAARPLPERPAPAPFPPDSFAVPRADWPRYLRPARIDSLPCAARGCLKVDAMQGHRPRGIA